MVSPLTATALRPIRRARNRRAIRIDSPDGVQAASFVRLGGIPQFTTVRGHHRSNPVVLVVHGGPGSPYAPFNPWLGAWERALTVVQWDQRGAGKTFRRAGGRADPTLSVERLVSDGIALAELINDWFPDSPVVLLGSSLGAATGAAIVRRRPDLFSSYVAANLCAPDSRSESFRLTRAYWERVGVRRAVDTLDRLGPNPAAWTPEQAQMVSKLAIKANRDVPDMVYDLMLPALMYSPDYTMRDIRAVDRGMRVSLRGLHTGFMDFDYRIMTDNFPLPFIAIHGTGDLVNPVSSAERLVQRVNAPHTDFVVVPGAGHLVEFSAVEEVARHLLRAATVA